MRIIAAQPGPHFSVHDVHTGWVEALRGLGHKVAEYNLSDRLTFYDAAMIELPDKQLRKALPHEQAYELAANGLYAMLYKNKPDLLFVTSGFFYPAEMWDIARSYGTRIVMLHTESPYEDDRQLFLPENVISISSTIQRISVYSKVSILKATTCHTVIVQVSTV